MENKKEAELANLEQQSKISGEVKLSKEELTLIGKFLFNNRWTGQEYEQTIQPLINKLAELAKVRK